MNKEQVDKLTATVTQTFSCFGGGKKSSWGNPLAAAFEDRPPMFAAGVDVRQVVEFVLTESSRENN